MRTISGNLRDGELFFVCGRIDQVDEEEVARAKSRLTQILAPLTQQGERRVYFVDARTALRARMEHNDARAQESGIQALEQDLKAFLSAKRSGVKLARAAAGLQGSIREARLSIRENAQHAADDIMREISDALDAQDIVVRDVSRALALDI